MKRLNAVAVIRHNTSLGGDLALAVRELDALAGQKGKLVSDRDALRSTVKGNRVADLVELRNGDDGVALSWPELNADSAAEMLQRSAFLQELIVIHNSDDIQERLELASAFSANSNELECRLSVHLAWGYIIESEGVLGPSLLEGRVQHTIDLLLEPFLQIKSSSQSLRIRRAKKTTLSLSHDLHIYKAKFFPRMVRALLNIFGKDAKIVSDPFCGSGTALLEASLLGYDSVGVDIDPICRMISQAKVAPFLDPATTLAALDCFEAALDRCNEEKEITFDLPEELKKKLLRRDRIDGTAFTEEISRDARVLTAAIHATKAQRGQIDLLCVLASDAVTKKIRYRFIGVGNGKYTIEITKQPILERVREKIRRARELCYVFQDLKKFGLKIGSVKVYDGDARCPQEWTRKQAGIIITSPPYLPASSGREHYTASRALSFAVLGLEHGASGYFNSVSNGKGSTFDLSEFPESDRLLKYLESDKSDDADPQRDAMRFERKAMPTRQYLEDIASFFKVAKGVLTADGVLLLVVANQHTFYSHRRKELEHIVSGRNLYAEIALTADLCLQEEIKMKLLKPSVTNARPRASEDYFESVLVVRATAQSKERSPTSETRKVA